MAALEVLELGGGEADVTITLNFTSIFAWVGGIFCAAVMLWILGWIVRSIVGMGEFLGIWADFGRRFRSGVDWMKSRFRSNGERA